MDEEGYDVKFVKCKWKVIKGNLAIAQGNKNGTLYMVELTLGEENATIGDRESSTLWHQILGHVSEKRMQILASKGRIPELKNVRVALCEPFVFSKQKGVTFMKIGQPPKSEKLEVIYSEVFGPTPVSSTRSS